MTEHAAAVAEARAAVREWVMHDGTSSYLPAGNRLADALAGLADLLDPPPTKEQQACDHPRDQLQLREDGYTRDWGTTIDDEEQMIHASYTGSEDFGEEGTGEYLHCHKCGAQLPVPEGYEINWV